MWSGTGSNCRPSAFQFYELFGFERHYEGDEFPGFLAIRHGDAIIGLQRASSENPPYSEGPRWQFELTEAGELDQVIAIRQTRDLAYDVVSEEGGDRFRRRLVSVCSPAGVTVWFEGVNKADHRAG